MRLVATFEMPSSATCAPPSCGDRVVPVVTEHPCVERVSALGDPAIIEVGGELVDEQVLHARRGARVAREHRALDDLREPGDGEDVPVGIGQEPGEEGTTGRILELLVQRVHPCLTGGAD